VKYIDKPSFNWVEKVTLVFLGITALISLIISLSDFIGIIILVG